jgi:hypothetical protein
MLQNSHNSAALIKMAKQDLGYYALVDMNSHNHPALEGFKRCYFNVDLADDFEDNLVEHLDLATSNQGKRCKKVILSPPGLSALLYRVIPIVHGLTGNYPIIVPLIKQKRFSGYPSDPIYILGDPVDLEDLYALGFVGNKA